jgi:hypothetical protein
MEERMTTYYQGPEAAIDAETQERLTRQRVFHYINTIERGFADWANLFPPRARELFEVAEYLENNPEAFGQIYLKGLKEVIDQYRAETVVLSQTLRENAIEEERAQNVSIVDLAAGHK